MLAVVGVEGRLESRCVLVWALGDCGGVGVWTKKMRREHVRL